MRLLTYNILYIILLLFLKKTSPLAYQYRDYKIFAWYVWVFTILMALQMLNKHNIYLLLTFEQVCPIFYLKKVKSSEFCADFIANIQSYLGSLWKRFGVSDLKSVQWFSECVGSIFLHLWRNIWILLMVFLALKSHH